jgi:hypothetical protein
VSPVPHSPSWPGSSWSSLVEASLICAYIGTVLQLTAAGALSNPSYCPLFVARAPAPPRLAARLSVSRVVCPGLLALARLLPAQAALVLPHRSTALACLADADPTIQQAALRLVRGLVATPQDAAETSEYLLRLVRGGAVDPPFQYQLVGALLEVNSQDHYAHVADFAW